MFDSDFSEPDLLEEFFHYVVDVKKIVSTLGGSQEFLQMEGRLVFKAP